MARSLAHRGPDGEGVWVEGGIGLGHRRLAIRDVSDAGKQPCFSICGRIVAVYNGEIYNEQELQEGLEQNFGFTRRTRCDTELIPAGYLAWGEEFFSRVEGIFAIAIWDRADNRLLLARDAIGTKPLYIAKTSDGLAFGSEPKAILTIPGFNAQLSVPDVAAMLALGYPAPNRCLLQDVSQLNPGTVGIYTQNGDRTREFWRPRRREISSNSELQVSRLRERLGTVVASQLVSDVPVGIMQSGGIDSSLITLSVPATADIPLFCVRFQETSHDESKFAEQIARTAGRHLRMIDLRSDADLVEDFQQVVQHCDGQLSDSSALAVYRLSREVREHVTVALSGDGSDEFFAGYPTYRATIWASRSPASLSALAGSMAAWLNLSLPVSGARISIREQITRFSTGLSQPVPHAVWRYYLSPWDREALYGPAMATALADDPFAAYADEFLGADGTPADRGMVADQRYYLPADMLTKLDRMSMAHGLEVRVPFLDRRIMNFAATIPLDQLLHRGRGKYLLRQAVAAMGGPVLLATSSKKGFNVPMSAMLQHGLRPLADRLLSRDADVLAPFLNPDTVRRMWQEHVSGRVDRKYVIWTMLTLAVWRERLGA